MNVERGTFEGEETPEQRAELDARLEAAAEKARHDPRFAHLFTAEYAQSSLERARADIAAGRFVPHESVAEWLKTWNTPEAGPPPREWFE